MKTRIAEYRAKGNKRYLILFRSDDGCYSYTGDGCGGVLGVKPSDEQAIKEFESRQVSCLQLDFPSVKRVY